MSDSPLSSQAAAGGPLTRCPSGGQPRWAPGIRALPPPPILEPLPIRAHSDEALGALDHSPPQELGKERCLTSACSVQEGQQRGQVSELETRQRRQPQESRSQEPQGAEASGPRDSRAGPACSGSPGPRACHSRAAGDKQELKVAGGGGRPPALAAKGWRRRWPSPHIPGHPTSPLLGDWGRGDPSALEGWGRRCGLSVHDVSVEVGADPGPKPARLPRQQAHSKAGVREPGGSLGG